MQFIEKDVKKFIVIFSLIILGILVFLVLKPVLVSVAAGMLLAYLFMPVYKKITSFVRNRTLAAWILLILLLVVLIIPFWLFLPVFIEQIFRLFQNMQTLNIEQITREFFPGASKQFIAQVSLTFNDLVAKITNFLLNYVLNLSVGIPYLLIHLAVSGFVFFFSLRDSEILSNFISEISPFSKSKRSAIVAHFKNITDSLIYGHVLAGIVQGIFAGIGFYLLGLSNSMLLTFFAILLSILPIVGVFIMWVPICLYLFASGNTTTGTLYLLYNLIIVSNIDNLLRTYVIAKRTEISQAVIFVGMMGGIFVFGIIGLILGPLILAYFIVLLKSYQDKTLYTLFSDEKS